MLSVYLGDLELKKGLMCLKVCNCVAALSFKVTPVNIALFESLDHRKPQHRITKMKRCWRLKRRKKCIQSNITENLLLLCVSFH